MNTDHNPLLPPPYSESEPPLPGLKQPSNNPDMPEYVPAPDQQPTTITVIQTIAPQQYGPEPARLTCPSCRASISTKVVHENSSKTHSMCLLMCLMGLWLCCFFPYLMDSCRNTNHYCPSCNAYLGTYQQ